MKKYRKIFVRYGLSATSARDSIPCACRTQWVVAFLLVLACGNQSIGQRLFSINTNPHTRGYLITMSGRELPNLPLIIILHANGSSALQTFCSESLWKNLSIPAILAFPIAKNENWGCQDSTESYSNQNFLSLLIEHAYENYKVDRNRVYIIASDEGYCFSQNFYKSHSKMVAAVFEYSPKQEADEKSIVTAINLMIRSAPEKDMGYQLWKKTDLDGISDEETRIDSIKRNRWERRMTIAVKASRFVMLPVVKTGIDDKTYTDMSDVKRLYILEATKWMRDSMAWFINVGWLKVPKKQEVSFEYNGATASVNGEGSGGAIFPVAIGFKYALHRYEFRPYFQLGTGPMVVFVAGGEFTTSSTTLDPAAVRDKIKSELRLVMHFSLGSGYEWRLGKHLYNTGELKYLHSGRFDSIGQVNAIKGFSIGFGFGYIMGIKKDLKA